MPVQRMSVAHTMDAAPVATLLLTKGSLVPKGKPSCRHTTAASSSNLSGANPEVPKQMRPHRPWLKISTAPKCISSHSAVA